MKKQEAKSKTMEGVSGGRSGGVSDGRTGSVCGVCGVSGGRIIDGSSCGTKGRSEDGSSGRSGNGSGSQDKYRNRRVTVRLTEGEFELVMRLAKRGNVVHGSGSTMSDVLRGLIFSALSSLLVLMDGGMAERLAMSVTGNALRNGGTKARGLSGDAGLDCCVDVGSEIFELFEECEKDGKERDWPGNIKERR